MQTELFDAAAAKIPLGPGAWLLPAAAAARQAELLAAIESCAAAAPLRHMTVPGGHTMSVALTNAGAAGWTSDRRGYRYAPLDPLSGLAWPPLPPVVIGIARAASRLAGFADWHGDMCLINRYRPGARLSLHQDRDEADHDHPIVSISLGLPATFLFGGPERGDPVRRLRLHSGDVVVWGGPSRLAWHGVAPLADGRHPLTGPLRYNVTLRRAC